MLGNSPLYDKYIFNYNQSVGVRLFGGYKWRTFNQGQVAQGHNSAFVDDDGKAYIVYHSRTTDGSEGHTVKVHQLFLNEQGWLVAAPYITDGDTYSGVALKMNVENTLVETDVFTAVGENTQITVWGSRSID